MKGDGRPLVFYVLAGLAFLWFGIWSIADFADANGFIMVKNNFDADRGAAGVFGIITAILMLLISIGSAVNIAMFYKRWKIDSELNLINLVYWIRNHV